MTAEFSDEGFWTVSAQRGLSPLFWSHANLYGTIEIDMDRHWTSGKARPLIVKGAIRFR